MAENFELLEIGQIEIMHEQIHNRLDENVDCNIVRMQHDSLAAELVKRGLPHDTEIICPESELAQKAPNYRRGFTDEICTQCAFGQLFPFCNLYKADYVKGDTCDSFRYFEILELEFPHGFLLAKGKQTAIANNEPFDKKTRIIVSDGEVFGIVVLDEPAQIKTKEFNNDEWQLQHRITSRERWQWWPDTEVFYVYRVKEWHPYEDIKLYENGKIIDEPKLSAKQWKIVSKAKELPKQITLLKNAVSVTEKSEFVIDLTAKCKQLDSVLAATYETDVKEAVTANELIPIYSLALVRNPRMRVSKKNIKIGNFNYPVRLDSTVPPDQIIMSGGNAVNITNIEVSEKQEGETMPFRIRKRDDEYCVIKINADDSDGDVSGCHETREEAEAQLTALNINVTAEEDRSVHENKPKCKPKKRKKEESTQEEEKAIFEGLDKIIQTGIPEKPKKAGFIENLKSLGKSITDFLKSAEIEEKEGLLFANDAGIAQKMVNGELWHFTWTTNAFRDREGEIFSTKALEKYVLESEKQKDRGLFNFWHINEEDGNFNTDFARKKWQGVVGRFLVEFGSYLDNDLGQKAKEFFNEFSNGHPEIAPEGWGCSPEYRYLPEERATGVYENIWITRTSTLPRMAAANVWTNTSQLERGDKMALTEDQVKGAIAFLGEEKYNSMVAEGETKTTELEKNTDHKGKTEITKDEIKEVSISPEQFIVLVQEVAKQFEINNASITEALTIMADGLNEIGERVKELEGRDKAKGLAETPSFTFSLQRASERDETIVAEDDKLKDEKPKETQRAKNQSEISPADFFATN